MGCGLWFVVFVACGGGSKEQYLGDGRASSSSSCVTPMLVYVTEFMAGFRY